MSSPAPGLPQVWNHRVHQRWAGEDLTFCRLAFFPEYDQEAIVQRLHEVLCGLGVRAYAIYETLGLFDLFVRAWLPSHTIARFEEQANKALAEHSLQVLEIFAVSRIVRHWIWDDGNGGVHEPEAALLEQRWSDEEIARADAGKLTEPEKRTYDEDLHVLRQLPAPDSESEGIKFLTVIASSVYSITYQTRIELERRLLEILDTLEIDEPSLYEGIGFGQFILMGRVRPEEFFKIPGIAQAINDAGIQDAVTARPYTFMSLRKTHVYFADRLPLTQEEEELDELDVAKLLAQGAGQRLEVVDAARLDWRRYLAGDGQLAMSEDVLNDGIIRAVVGLLNADGGDVVVGALRRDRRLGDLAAEEHPKLAGFPHSGEFICVGVNEEYNEREWDAFRVQLQDLINARVDPPPSGAVELIRHRVEDRDLCVIRVKPSRATWYYRYISDTEPIKFFVREGDRTVAYSGSRADMLKQARPRG